MTKMMGIEPVRWQTRSRRQKGRPMPYTTIPLSVTYGSETGGVGKTIESAAGRVAADTGHAGNNAPVDQQECATGPKYRSEEQ